MKLNRKIALSLIVSAIILLMLSSQLSLNSLNLDTHLKLSSGSSHGLAGSSDKAALFSLNNNSQKNELNKLKENYQITNENKSEFKLDAASLRKKYPQISRHLKRGIASSNTVLMFLIEYSK